MPSCLRILFCSLIVANLALGAIAELNIDGFAGCLGQTLAKPDLENLRQKYGFGFGDGLLSYLAVYPGRRLPGESSFKQENSFQKWSENFDQQAETLAMKLVQASTSNEPLYPVDILSAARAICSDDFCEALLSHNVLR